MNLLDGYTTLEAMKGKWKNIKTGSYYWVKGWCINAKNKEIMIRYISENILEEREYVLEINEFLEKFEKN